MQGTGRAGLLESQSWMGKYDRILWHQGLKQSLVSIADTSEAHTSQTGSEVESKSTSLSSCNSKTAFEDTLNLTLKISESTTIPEKLFIFLEYIGGGI